MISREIIKKVLKKFKYKYLIIFSVPFILSFLILNYLPDVINIESSKLKINTTSFLICKNEQINPKKVVVDQNQKNKTDKCASKPECRVIIPVPPTKPEDDDEEPK